MIFAEGMLTVYQKTHWLENR